MKLSFAVLLVLFVIPACAISPYPKEYVYIADLKSKVCAEYEIVDIETIKFKLRQELPLMVGGPCDGMTGYSRRGFKRVQNWIRDTIKKCNQ